MSRQGPPGSPAHTVAWESAKDQRKIKGLQLELRLAEERIALLEAGQMSPSTVRASAAGTQASDAHVPGCCTFEPLVSSLCSIKEARIRLIFWYSSTAAHVQAAGYCSRVIWKGELLHKRR